jgi:hypothetical protein
MAMRNKPGEPGEHPDYLSFLMRLWRVPGDGHSWCSREASWRASLESAQTGATQSFADLEDLFAFLRQQTSHTPEVEEAEDDHATTVIVVIHRAGRRQGGS